MKLLTGSACMIQLLKPVSNWRHAINILLKVNLNEIYNLKFIGFYLNPDARDEKEGNFLLNLDSSVLADRIWHCTYLVATCTLHILCTCSITFTVCHLFILDKWLSLCF